MLESSGAVNLPKTGGGASGFFAELKTSSVKCRQTVAHGGPYGERGRLHSSKEN